jgi:lipoprotein-releasing system permease protein
VIAVSPTLAATATFAYKDKVENAAMLGVEPLEADRISGISGEMVQGDFYSILSGRRLVMGRALADKLGVRMGDTVQVTFPNARPTRLVISGIFDFGFEPVDLGVTYVSMDTARSFLGQGDVVTTIDIKLDDPYLSSTAVAELSSFGYNAKGWQELYPDIVRTLAFEKTNNFLTMMLLMVIATFGIASIMNMLVLEKTREIGMLMAMGATPSNIMKLFLIESGALGLIGAAFGCLLGLYASIQLQGIEIQSPMGEAMKLPILINPQDFLVFTLIAVFMSMLAGTYPAYKASRLDPVVALRG